MNVKGELQEVFQKRGLVKPVYSCVRSEGAAHCPVFVYRVTVEWEGKTISKTGEGRTKKEAEKAAALAMLEHIRKPDQEDEYDPYDEPVSSPSQFKVTLSELLQGEHLPLPQYEEVSAKGPAHKKEFTIKCTVRIDDETIYERFGRGPSKKLAESDAAVNMLSYLETRAGGRGLSRNDDGAARPRASGGSERTVDPAVLRGVEVDYVDMMGEHGTFLCLASTDTQAAHGYSTDSREQARHKALHNLKLSVMDLSS